MVQTTEVLQIYYNRRIPGEERLVILITIASMLRPLILGPGCYISVIVHIVVHSHKSLDKLLYLVLLETGAMDKGRWSFQVLSY